VNFIPVFDLNDRDYIVSIIVLFIIHIVIALLIVLIVFSYEKRKSKKLERKI
jgi:hypothetical protein